MFYPSFRFWSVLWVWNLSKPHEETGGKCGILIGAAERCSAGRVVISAGHIFVPPRGGGGSGRFFMGS